MASYNELIGKVAIVTGAGRNIGRAIALALAEGGASIVVNARSNRAEADAVAREIEAAGGEALVNIGDVSDAAVMDLEFHRAIWAASGNEFLQQVLDPLATLLFAHNLLERVSFTHRKWQLNHHRALLDVMLGPANQDVRAIFLKHLQAASSGEVEDAAPKRVHTTRPKNRPTKRKKMTLEKAG